MLVVVKVTVVVGDNKQTKQTNTFFLFLSSALLLFFDDRLNEEFLDSFCCCDEETKNFGREKAFGSELFELSDVELSSTSPISSFTFYAYKHTHTHTQCSLYNPKSPAPRSSPKLSPTSNNDPPSSRRRLPTAKVRFRGENNFSRKKRTNPQILSLDG